MWTVKTLIRLGRSVFCCNNSKRCVFLMTWLILTFLFSRLSRVVRKPAFCICENKDADQLRGNREADQRLCFRYIDNTIPLLPKPLAIFCGCTDRFVWDLIETPKTGFLTTRLICLSLLGIIVKGYKVGGVLWSVF